MGHKRHETGRHTEWPVAGERGHLCSMCLPFLRLIPILWVTPLEIIDMLQSRASMHTGPSYLNHKSLWDVY